MAVCGSILKTVKSVKVRENTLEPEVILVEKEDLKVSVQKLQLIYIGFVIAITICELDILSKNAHSNLNPRVLPVQDLRNANKFNSIQFNVVI
jgi:hypothetical protein